MALLISNVVIRDNGLRSFVPPCFCWDLLDSAGKVVFSVSEVDLGLVRHDMTLADVLKRQSRVSGEVDSYAIEVGGQVVSGKRFIVLDVIE